MNKAAVAKEANMLDENGGIKKDIFIKDKLHLNEKGYKIWANIIKPEISLP